MDDRLKEIGLATPQLAEAKAIEALSNPEGKRNRTLSVVKTNDLPRFNLIYALYDITGYQWISKAAENELDLRASLSRKGVRGRDDLVRICADQEESRGVLDSFKEKISSFFRSGT